MLLFHLGNGSDSFGHEARGHQAMNLKGDPTVLVVDDDRGHSRALAKTFERAGYRVSTASDGQEALMILTERAYDLVITDLKMPRMNGLDLLRNIRALTPQAAVVILTAYGEWTTYMNAMDNGAVDYLNKPVRRDEILMVARKALARRGVRPPGISRCDTTENPA